VARGIGLQGITKGKKIKNFERGRVKRSLKTCGVKNGKGL